MPSLTSNLYGFGAFTLDTQNRVLRREGQLIPLTPKAFDVLLLLIQNPGKVVAKDELMRTVWPDSFVEESNLTQTIFMLRKALGETAGQRYILTVQGRGYRFAMDVRDVPIGREGPGNNASVATVAAPPVNNQARSNVWTQRRWLVAGTAAILVLAAGVYIAIRGRAEYSKQPRITSIAVLPLKNLSGDPSQDYLADGITEELVGRLATIHDLRVISRTSVMHFKDTKLLVPDIARQLGVQAIVEGSVIRDDNRIRVHAQLIRAATDEHIWADEFDRDFNNLLALEDDLTRSIAQQIKMTLESQQANIRAHQVDPAAYDDYLIGRYHFNQRTPDAVNKSIAQFEQAIERDPKFALAYSGLADAYALLGYRGAYPSKEALAQAKTAALKAIELDPRLAEPHTSLAFIAETYEWDWASSEREYKRALELNPNDSRAHHFYAGYLTYVGRFDDGIAEERRARDLDPLSLPVNNALAGRLIAAGRSQEALDQARATLDLDANFAPVHQTLGWIFLKAGKPEEAVEEFRRALQLSGANDIYLRSDLAFACAVTGKRDEAEKALAEIKGLHDKGLAPSGSIAVIYGALGETDEAFAWLEKAYQERDPELTYIKVGRRFGPLQHDPRWHELVRRMGLPE